MNRMTKVLSAFIYICAIVMYLAVIGFAGGIDSELIQPEVDTAKPDQVAEIARLAYVQPDEPPDNYVNRIPDEPCVEVPEHEITMLARLVWGEAGSCPADEQRLVVWTVFQRVDDGRFGGDSIEDVITARNQFMGYSPKNRVDSEIYDMCTEEYLKWKNGEEAPTLEPYAPETPYFFFEGRRGEDGKLHNFFRKNWR